MNNLSYKLYSYLLCCTNCFLTQIGNYNVYPFTQVDLKKFNNYRDYISNVDLSPCNKVYTSVSSRPFSILFFSLHTSSIFFFFLLKIQKNLNIVLWWKTRLSGLDDASISCSCVVTIAQIPVYVYPWYFYYFNTNLPKAIDFWNFIKYFQSMWTVMRQDCKSIHNEEND